MTLFSRRHRVAISNETLLVELDERLRNRLVIVLGQFDGSYYYRPDPNDNWTESIWMFEKLLDDLKALYGLEKLSTKSGNVTDTDVDIRTWVRQGPGWGVLDASEQMLTYQSPEQKIELISEINRIFEEEDSDWRILNSEFVKLDSVFVHDQVIAKAVGLLGEVDWQGAVIELTAAQNDLLDGKGRSAVHNAGSSVESTMKAALERHDGTYAELLKQLDRDGWFDELPEELRNSFRENVLMGLPWMRNRLGGHGQGVTARPVEIPYARLAIGLSAVISEFIVSLALSRSSAVKHSDPAAPGGFTPVSDFDPPDDDIPF